MCAAVANCFELTHDLLARFRHTYFSLSVFCCGTQRQKNYDTFLEKNWVIWAVLWHVSAM